jgi:hypothetical protein
MWSFIYLLRALRNASTEKHYGSILQMLRNLAWFGAAGEYFLL